MCGFGCVISLVHPPNHRLDLPLSLSKKRTNSLQKKNTKTHDSIGDRSGARPLVRGCPVRASKTPASGRLTVGEVQFQGMGPIGQGRLLRSAEPVGRSRRVGERTSRRDRTEVATTEWDVGHGSAWKRCRGSGFFHVLRILEIRLDYQRPAYVDRHWRNGRLTPSKCGKPERMETPS